MVDGIGRVLSYRMSVGELIGLGLIVGTPYLIIGLVWSLTHTARAEC
jgi:hypothetical protein